MAANVAVVVRSENQVKLLLDLFHDADVDVESAVVMVVVVERNDNPMSDC